MNELLLNIRGRINLLSERQMSLLVALKIAGIKAEIATGILGVLENETQAKELEKFVEENKPLSEKVLLAKVKKLTGKDVV